MSEASAEVKDIGLKPQQTPASGSFTLRRPLDKLDDRKEVLAQQELRQLQFNQDLADVFEPYTTALLGMARQEPNKKNQEWADVVKAEDGQQFHTFIELEYHKMKVRHGKSKVDDVELDRFAIYFSDSKIEGDKLNRFYEYPGLFIRYSRGLPYSMEFRWKTKEPLFYIRHTSELENFVKGPYEKFAMKDANCRSVQLIFHNKKGKMQVFKVITVYEDRFLSGGRLQGFAIGEEVFLYDKETSSFKGYGGSEKTDKDVLGGVKAILSVIPTDPI